MSCSEKGSQCCKNNQKDEVVDYLVCTCMDVMYSDICRAIDQGADTFQKLSDQLGVGTGCSSCVIEVEQILKTKLQLKKQ